MTTRIISIGNQKGGVGKTTTAINLAAAIAERKKRVLMIDLDPQANATSGLGREKTPGQSAYDALVDDADLSERIKFTDIPRLDLIPGEVDMAGAEVDLPRMDGYLHRLERALAPIRDSNTYDFIFLDCPPSLGVLTMNALCASDSLLVPLQCEYYALEGLSVITSLLKRLRDQGANPRLSLEGIVLTMFDKRTNLALEVVREVRTHFADHVYDVLIPRSVRLSEAPSHGSSILKYAPTSPGAEAYRALAKEFLKRVKANYIEPIRPAFAIDEEAPPPLPPSDDELEEDGVVSMNALLNDPDDEGKD